MRAKYRRLGGGFDDRYYLKKQQNEIKSENGESNPRSLVLLFLKVLEKGFLRLQDMKGRIKGEAFVQGGFTLG